MKLLDSFLLEAIEEKLSAAVRYGVTRAYKHSDMQPPTDPMVDLICESVRNAIFEIVDFDAE